MTRYRISAGLDEAQAAGTHIGKARDWIAAEQGRPRDRLRTPPRCSGTARCASATPDTRRPRPPTADPGRSTSTTPGQSSASPADVPEPTLYIALHITCIIARCRSAGGITTTICRRRPFSDRVRAHRRSPPRPRFSALERPSDRSGDRSAPRQPLPPNQEQPSSKTLGYTPQP